MLKEDIIAKAKKLKALADRGVGGEAKNAKEMLEKFCVEHNIVLDEIGEQIRTWNLTSLNESSVILQKVIWSINPKALINSEKHKSKLIIKVALSDIEYREAVQKFRYFWKAYNEERQIFLSAFFNRHYQYFVPESKIKAPTSTGKGQRMNPTGPPPPPTAVDAKEGMPTINSDEARRVHIIASALKNLRYVKSSQMLDYFGDDKYSEKSDDDTDDKKPNK